MALQSHHLTFFDGLMRIKTLEDESMYLIHKIRFIIPDPSDQTALQIHYNFSEETELIKTDGYACFVGLTDINRDLTGELMAFSPRNAQYRQLVHSSRLFVFDRSLNTSAPIRIAIRYPISSIERIAPAPEISNTIIVSFKTQQNSKKTQTN